MGRNPYIFWWPEVKASVWRLRTGKTFWFLVFLVTQPLFYLQTFWKYYKTPFNMSKHTKWPTNYLFLLCIIFPRLFYSPVPTRTGYFLGMHFRYCFMMYQDAGNSSHTFPMLDPPFSKHHNFFLSCSLFLWSTSSSNFLRKSIWEIMIIRITCGCVKNAFSCK